MFFGLLPTTGLAQIFQTEFLFGVCMGLGLGQGDSKHFFFLTFLCLFVFLFWQNAKFLHFFAFCDFAIFVGKDVLFVILHFLGSNCIFFIIIAESKFSLMDMKNFCPLQQKKEHVPEGFFIA